MAEAVFLHHITSLSHHPQHPLIISPFQNIDSAGTGAYHIGDAPNPRTMATLKRHGITDYHHRARKIQPGDFDRFDYILAMDRDNLLDLEHMLLRVAGGGEKEKKKKKTGKVALFGDYGGEVGEEVVDPYYGTDEDFEVAYQQMVRFTRGFVKQVLDTGEVQGTRDG